MADEQTDFNIAVETLETNGFEVELHEHRFRWSLEWGKGGARWRSSVEDAAPSAFNALGLAALGWFDARMRGTGEEELFAQAVHRRG